MPGGLVCLVPEAAGRGPLNVNLALPEGKGLSSFGAEAGEAVEVRGSEMVVGGRIAVSLASANRYSPRLRLASPLASSAGLEANIAAARRTGVALGRHAGLGQLLSGTWGRLNIFGAAGLPRMEGLVKALREADPRSAREEVRGLVGLGPGLTPSGDDALAGMALVLLLYSRTTGRMASSAEALARALRSESRGRTTAVSEAYLRQAAAGRGNEAVRGLCEAVLTGGPEEVERETRKVLAIGETSGTDVVLGVVIGGQLCLGDVRGAWRGGPW
jgi:hypothetical protein